MKLLNNEKKGLVPDTTWKKNTLGKGWVIGETLISGIGQGYIQTTPLQLCLMTAQLANGGYKINPKIIIEETSDSPEKIKLIMQKNYQEIINKDETKTTKEEIIDFLRKKKYDFNFKDPKNIENYNKAMYASTNEIRGTSYS